MTTNENASAPKDLGIQPEILLSTRGARLKIRKKALEHYRTLASPGHIVCVYCGFGIEEVLEVAHVDTDRTNNHHSNWAFLCPTCHRMYDLGLIPKRVIEDMRDNAKKVDWRLLMKDAGAKAAKTLKGNRAKAKRQMSAKKAVATRRANAANA